MTRRTSSPDQAARRRRAYLKGHTAEHVAVLWLRLKGYKILARRWRCPVGEIDILAWRSQTLIVIEVKARRTFDEAVEAVTWHNQRRIERAVRLFQGQNQGFANDGLRFDIIAVAGFSLRHVRDAWRQC